MSRAVDPALQTAALAALEGALNRALTLSPRRGGELAPFAGQVFALHCTAPESMSTCIRATAASASRAFTTGR